MCASVVAFAIVGSASQSPLAPLLPSGSGPALPLRAAARGFALHRLGLTEASILAVVVSAAACVAFIGATRLAWAGTLSIRLIIVLGLVFHLVVLLMPLVLSYDVFNYAIYGRIFAIHHANPYVQLPVAFPKDPFLRFAHPDWRTAPSVYGPGFTQLSGVLVRWFRDPASVVVAFRVLAAVSSAITMLVVTALAARIRPERAAFAAVAIGWNPLMLFEVVAAGQIDALLALALTASFALVALGWARRPQLRAVLDLAAMAVLVAGSMLKPTIGWLVILLGTVSVLRQPQGRRLLLALGHVVVALAVAVPMAMPFVQTQNPLLGFSTLTSVVGDLLRPSPAVIIESFFDSTLGPLARALGVTGFRGPLRVAVVAVLFAVFLAALGLVLVRLRRVREITLPEDGAAWGWTLLLFLLTAPFLFPRYVVWVLPLVWLLPCVPRLGALSLSVAVRLVDPLAAAPVTPGFYLTLVDVGTAIVGIGATALLVVLLHDLWSRVSAGHPLDSEAALPPLFRYPVAFRRKT
jgi:hypothetical protein